MKIKNKEVFLSRLKKCGFELKEIEISHFFNDIEKFIKAVQRIYVYPQARVNLKPNKDNPKIKDIVRTIQLEEIGKVKKDNEKISITELFKRLKEGIDNGNRK